MSKLKLYNSSESSREEITKDFKELINFMDLMGEEDSRRIFLTGEQGIYSQSNYQIYREEYTRDLKHILDGKPNEDLISYLNSFERFIDAKYLNKSKTDLSSRMERDLMKYKALSFIEHKAISRLLEEGSEAAKAYIENASLIEERSDLDKIKKIELQENEFSKFIKAYKEECEQIPGYKDYENIEKLHKKVNSIFVNLASNYYSSEYKKIANIIKTDEVVSDLGKYTFWEKVNDMITSVLSNMQKITQTIMSAFSGGKKNIDVLIPQYAPPSVPSTKVNSVALTEPMPRTPEEAMKMWGPPPAAPKQEQQNYPLSNEVNSVALTEPMTETTEEAMKMWSKQGSVSKVSSILTKEKESSSMSRRANNSGGISRL